MTTRNILVIMTALVASAAIILLWMLSESNATLERQRTEMEARQQEQADRFAVVRKRQQQEIESLREELCRARTRPPKLSGGAAVSQNRTAPESTRSKDASARNGSSPEKGSSFIRLQRDLLQTIRFDALDDTFGVTSQAAQLLEITPEEYDRLQALLDDLKKNVQKHDGHHWQEMRPEDVRDSDVVRFLEENDGQQIVFRFPPYAEPERVAVRAWFDGAVEEILGADRKELFTANARKALDFWLGGTEDKIVAFADQYDSDGNPVEHAWIVKFNTPSSQGTMSGSGNQAIPKKVEYLFEIAEGQDRQ